MHSRWIVALALVLLLLLASCGSVTEVAQPQADPQTAWTLAGAHSIGQTLVAYHDGLDGVEVALLPVPHASGGPVLGERLPSLTFSLHSDPLDPERLREATVVTSTLTSDGWVRLAFPPLDDSRNRRFYLQISWPAADTLPGQGAVTVPVGPAASYRSGAAYLDGRAQEAQLAFRLTYDNGAMALGMLKRAITGLPQAVAVLLLFLLPGLALTTWLLPRGSAGRY